MVSKYKNNMVQDIMSWLFITVVVLVALSLLVGAFFMAWAMISESF